MIKNNSWMAIAFTDANVTEFIYTPQTKSIYLTANEKPFFIIDNDGIDDYLSSNPDCSYSLNHYWIQLANEITQNHLNWGFSFNKEREITFTKYEYEQEFKINFSPTEDEDYLNLLEQLKKERNNE